MTDWWSHIKSLFSKVEESSSKEPVIHELIERSEVYTAQYERWKTTLASNRILTWIHEQYLAFDNPTAQKDRAVDFLNTPSTKGFVIHFYLTQYRKEEILYFFDLLKEKVLELNYTSYVSDSKLFNRKNWVEKVERHYLKPRLNFHKQKEEKFVQSFGNIKIELEMRNDKVQNLRFSATTYRDHQFEVADDFKNLMHLLVN